MDPPDSIPNSEVKRCYADGSVGDSHVRVGHRQVYSYEPLMRERRGFLIFWGKDIVLDVFGD